MALRTQVSTLLKFSRPLMRTPTQRVHTTPSNLNLWIELQFNIVNIEYKNKNGTYQSGNYTLNPQVIPKKFHKDIPKTIKMKKYIIVWNFDKSRFSTFPLLNVNHFSCVPNECFNSYLLDLRLNIINDNITHKKSNNIFSPLKDYEKHLIDYLNSVRDIISTNIIDPHDEITKRQILKRYNKNIEWINNDNPHMRSNNNANAYITALRIELETY